jgi:hypothetical protein
MAYYIYTYHWMSQQISAVRQALLHNVCSTMTNGPEAREFISSKRGVIESRAGLVGAKKQLNNTVLFTAFVHHHMLICGAEMVAADYLSRRSLGVRTY